MTNYANSAEGAEYLKYMDEGTETEGTVYKPTEMMYITPQC